MNEDKTYKTIKQGKNVANRGQAIVGEQGSGPKNTVTTPQSPAQSQTPEVKPRKLTRKRQAFIKHLVDNPKDSATEAVAQTYNVSTRHSAEQIAHELMSKPEIQAELSKYLGQAEMVMIEVMNYSKELGKSGTGAGAAYAGVAIGASKDVQDRLKGKATQVTEVTSKVVTLNVDLTQTVDKS